jgi:predicted  nucleic acid-binding Zn-ribbon protein
MDKGKIISITDIIENKVRKQRELDDYNARLEELQRQKFWLEKEIQMAEFIIAAVQSEISPKAFVQAIIDHELGKMDDDE